MFPHLNILVRRDSPEVNLFMSTPFAPWSKWSLLWEIIYLNVFNTVNDNVDGHLNYYRFYYEVIHSRNISFYSIYHIRRNDENHNRVSFFIYGALAMQMNGIAPLKD
jgi:hypothetical protein